MMKKLTQIASGFISAALLSTAITAQADSLDAQKPLLVIGASYSDARVPFNDSLLAPLFGIAVGFGSYLSLGDALIKDSRLPGYVINEAQAGATTFARSSCFPGPSCTWGDWQSYSTQLQKALARVTIPGTNIMLAKYVVISTPNDCLHSEAFGVYHTEATPCTLTQMHQAVDRMIAVGQQALSAGLVPIYDEYPEWSNLNLPLFSQTFGLSWAINEADYNMLKTLKHTRITNELPGAVILNMWQDFEHMGDGIHPNDKTSRKAAAAIAQYIIQN